MVGYIPLTKGRIALVDTVDYQNLSVFNWMFHGGYARRVEKGRTIHMHRVLTGCPDGLEVDHINRNKLDNRKCNLRIVTRQQNMFNKSGYTGSSSKYKGVSWHSKDRTWHAQIRLDNEIHFLGAYGTEDIAAAAYNHFAILYFGDYAVLNEVDSLDFSAFRILKRKGASRYRGVTFNKKSAKWVARITAEGKRLALGYFGTEEDAARAYNEAFMKYKNGKAVPNPI